MQTNNKVEVAAFGWGFDAFTLCSFDERGSKTIPCAPNVERKSRLGTQATFSFDAAIVKKQRPAQASEYLFYILRFQSYVK